MRYRAFLLGFLLVVMGAIGVTTSIDTLEASSPVVCAEGDSGCTRLWWKIPSGLQCAGAGGYCDAACEGIKNVDEAEDLGTNCQCRCGTCPGLITEAAASAKAGFTMKLVPKDPKALLKPNQITLPPNR